MLIHQNVLSENLLDEIEKEIVNNFNNACWRVGGLAWHKGLSEGSNGEILQTSVSNLLKERIDNDLKDFYPSANTKISLCLYGKGASLAMHNDEGWEWAATVYLNKDWNKNLGGTFLYTDNTNNEIWNAVFPKFNTMIINDAKETHMVTLVSAQAEEYRASIQIWGIK